MKTSTTIVCCALMALHSFLQQPCQASFFEMVLDRNSIYTPGNMNLVMRLTDEATVRGEYIFIITVSVGEAAIREQTLPTTKGRPAVFELNFPEVRGRTNVRCRTELFINTQFIEAQEKPLVLWPPWSRTQKQRKDEVMWVFDTSGALQKIFKDLRVQAADATFQAIRDFQMPDIIFVGEDVGPKSFQILMNQILSKDKSLDAVVFLGQKDFPENWPVQVTPAEKLPKNISCDPNSPLLSGLSKLDVMNMVSNAVPAKITKEKDKKWKADSYISEAGKDEKQVGSYLAVIKDRKLTTVYCQLPLTEAFSEDPRSALLLDNLLRFVYERSAPHDNQ